MTPIHDHVTWCVFGVVQGVEYEELFRLDEEDECLVEAGSNSNPAGDVSGFAPPGDIHRVRNAGDDVAISIHVYGDRRLPDRLERPALLRPAGASRLILGWALLADPSARCARNATMRIAITEMVMAGPSIFLPSCRVARTPCLGEA